MPGDFCSSSYTPASLFLVHRALHIVRLQTTFVPVFSILNRCVLLRYMNTSPLITTLVRPFLSRRVTFVPPVHTSLIVSVLHCVIQHASRSYTGWRRYVLLITQTLLPPIWLWSSCSPIQGNLWTLSYTLDSLSLFYSALRIDHAGFVPEFILWRSFVVGHTYTSPPFWGICSAGTHDHVPCFWPCSIPPHAGWLLTPIIFFLA